MTTTTLASDRLLPCVQCVLVLGLFAGLRAQEGDLGSEALRKAQRLIEVGKVDAAERELAVAVALLPEDPEARHALGYVYFRQGKLEESRKLLEEALEMSPANTKVLSKLGVVQARLKDFKAAEKTFAALVALTPDDPVARKNHGGALRDLGRLTEARAELKQALALKKDYADAYHALGLLEAKAGDSRAAFDMHETALELDPNHVDALNQSAVLLARDGQLEVAAERFQRAVELDPGHATARFNLAEALLRLEKPAEAQAELERVVVLEPKHAKAHFRLSQLYEKSGLTVKAAETREKSERLKREAEKAAAR